MAGHIEAERIRPDLVLCSPTRLSRETLERVEPAFGDPVERGFEEALYGASEAELLARLRPPKVDSVMIVGHNLDSRTSRSHWPRRRRSGRAWKRGFRPRDLD